jgi:hypothetical protein
LSNETEESFTFVQNKSHINELFIVLRKLLLIVVCLPLLSLSQENVTTVGFQLKPILPIKTFVDGPLQFNDYPYNGSLTSSTGYAFGMVIRRGFTKTLSIESGINYVRRNYQLRMSKIDSIALMDETEFGFVSYNIPIQGLVYIKLAERLFMNASTGVQADFYVSGTYTLGEEIEMTQTTWPHSRIGASYIANLGFEYRTERKGYFYFGASYSKPFGLMAVTRTTWRNDSAADYNYFIFLGGQYLTIDLRYFFNEKPQKKSKGSKTK